MPHQWSSGSALKTDVREVTSFNPSRACRPSRSEFFIVFYETCLNTGFGSLRKTPYGGNSKYSPRSFVWQFDLILGPSPNQFNKFNLFIGSTPKNIPLYHTNGPLPFIIFSIRPWSDINIYSIEFHYFILINLCVCLDIVLIK